MFAYKKMKDGNTNSEDLRKNLLKMLEVISILSKSKSIVYCSGPSKSGEMWNLGSDLETLNKKVQEALIIFVVLMCFTYLIKNGWVKGERCSQRSRCNGFKCLILFEGSSNRPILVWPKLKKLKNMELSAAISIYPLKIMQSCSVEEN